MAEEIFGVSIVRGPSPWEYAHEPRTVEVADAHQLLRGLSPEYDLTRLSYVTVTSFDNEGRRRALLQVPQLPTELGKAASNAFEWTATRWAALRVRSI